MVVAALNLPTFRNTAGPSQDAPRLRQAQALVNQLEVLHGRGPIRFDPTGLRYAEPFSGLIMAQLQDLGVPLVVDDEVLVRQLGEGRRDDGEARFSLREVEGPDAYTVPEGDERVAFVDGLSPDERPSCAPSSAAATPAPPSRETRPAPPPSTSRPGRAPSPCSSNRSPRTRSCQPARRSPDPPQVGGGPEAARRSCAFPPRRARTAAASRRTGPAAAGRAARRRKPTG